MTNNIEFRDIPSAPGYSVGSDGTVTGKRVGALRTHLRTGYPAVALSVRGVRISRNIHDLVLEAFVGPKPIGCCVRHLDGDPLNNCVENLTYGSWKENSADRTRHGRTIRGTACHAAKLNQDAVRDIRRRVAAGQTHRQATEPYGVDPYQAYSIVRGLTWKHVS